MSQGYRSRLQLHNASPDMKNYRAPRPPYSERLIWFIELLVAIPVGILLYAAVLAILSLQ